MRWVLAVSGALALLLVAGGVFLVSRDDPVDGKPYAGSRASEADLTAVAGTRVFFAHQSVGFDILNAVKALYGDRGSAAPNITESRTIATDPGITHMPVGTNGDAIGKMDDFDRVMRAGMAEQVDVAIIKLCYIDVDAHTNVEAVFEAYRNVMRALERDYPEVTFIAVTDPVTERRGLWGRIKTLSGRDDGLGAEHNVARERFNTLLRAEFGSTRQLFDLAAVQSTAPDGQRVAGRHDGTEYYSLYSGYASDPGHLNAEGGAAAASAMIATIADLGRP